MRTRRGCELDGLAFAHQLVGPLAVDLDRADRRRDLVDVAAQRGDRRLRSAASVTCVGRNRLQDFAFGVVGGRGLAQPNRRRVRLVGRGQQPEDLGGALDADHQHTGGHRVERARVADLAGAEDARHRPTTSWLVMPAGLSTIDQSGRDPALRRAHSTIAVSASPSATVQRPATWSAAARDSAAGSIRISERTSRAAPDASTSNVMCASSKPSQRCVSGNHAL